MMPFLDANVLRSLMAIVEYIYFNHEDKKGK